MNLYRPVGLKELELIYDSDMNVFPPRLPEQPIFYPVLNQQYAEQIAGEWNTTSEPYAGFVTKFTVDDAYISKFESHIVGGKLHKELWVPAEELENFNHHILSKIEIVASFFGDNYVGHIPDEGTFKNKDAKSQFIILKELRDYNMMDFSGTMQLNLKAIYLNYCFWCQTDFNFAGIDMVKRNEVLDAIKACWSRKELPVELPKNCFGN